MLTRSLTILRMMWFSRITISPEKTSWNLGRLGGSSSMSSELSFPACPGGCFHHCFSSFPPGSLLNCRLLCLLMTSLLKSKIKFKKMFTIGMSIIGAKTGSVCLYSDQLWKFGIPVSLPPNLWIHMKNDRVCAVLKIKPWGQTTAISCAVDKSLGIL